MEMRGKTINEEAYQEIAEAEKKTTDKRVSKKLRILLLRFGGKSLAETAGQMNCSVSTVRRLIVEYHRDGLAEYMRSKYVGNHRSLSIEEENESCPLLRKRQMQARSSRYRISKEPLTSELAKIPAAGTFICYLRDMGGAK